MPPKKPPTNSTNAPVVYSESRELVPVGPQHLWHKNATKRDESGKRPTTTRALVLRNGKYGAMGTGELAPFKLSGREKLELLAEDLIELSKTAISQPFRMEQCKLIVRSEFDARLDDISDLQDVSMFCDVIKAEVRARTKKEYFKGKELNPLEDSAQVARVVATCIHDAYMLASGWRIVRDMLDELDEGAEDKFIKNRLTADKDYRMRYLMLFDFVNSLANVVQLQFQTLVTNTDHYQKYFQYVVGTNPDEPEIQFDFSQLRTVYKSFLDSIVIELCLPESKIPRRILFQILNEAVDEAPRETTRFSQALWDSVGDLAVILQLQEILEAPLSGPEGAEWKSEPRPVPEEYETWQDAQLFSGRALSSTVNFKDLIFPIEKTKNEEVLKQLWTAINVNCYATCGDYIDALWGIEGAFNRTARWHGVERRKDEVTRSSYHRHNDRSQQRLAITDGYESHESMPSLQTVSDSDEDFLDDDEDSSDAYESDDEDEEYEYDSEDEEQMRELIREAMQTALDIDLLDRNNKEPAMESIPEDKKDNPFLKLLTALRGRVFQTGSKIKTTTRDQPRGGYSSTAPVRDVYSKRDPISFAKPSSPPEPVNRMPTVEEVEDEDNIRSAAKKKKKSKPKKKKKKVPNSQDVEAGGGVANPVVELDQPETPPPRSPTIEPEELVPSPNASPSASKKKKKKKRSPGTGASTTPAVSSPPRNATGHPSTNSTATFAPGASTISLTLAEQTAQSARSYIQKEGLDQPKAKVKSRPAHGSIFAVASTDEGRRGFFSKSSKQKEEASTIKEDQKGNRTWFSQLKKKSATFMHQLLRTLEDETKGQAGMRWENFVKTMQDMGFKHDPSAAGSRVRFDPADPSLRSITFHKPHPGSVINQVKLKKYSKQLTEHYGWTAEEFLHAGK